jgi:hypothetical protein
MICKRCGVELPGGRGAYRWRSEVVALGEDALYPTGIDGAAQSRHRVLQELAVMTPAEVEHDVYQLSEGVFCRCCRFELGRLFELFMKK